MGQFLGGRTKKLYTRGIYCVQQSVHFRVHRHYKRAHVSPAESGRGGRAEKGFKLSPARTSYASLMTLKRSSAFLGLSLFLSGCHFSAWDERARRSNEGNQCSRTHSIGFLCSLRSSYTRIRAAYQQDKPPPGRTRDRALTLANAYRIRGFFLL